VQHHVLRTRWQIGQLQKRLVLINAEIVVNGHVGN